jgi:hypothetical protein
VQALQTIPILRIFDEAKAREFYLGYLGFQVDWEHRFEPGMPLYMQTAPWNARLMEITDPFGNKLRFNEDL